MASRPLHSTFFKFEKKNAELFSSVVSVNFDIWEFLDYHGLPDIEVTMIGKGFPPPPGTPEMNNDPSSKFKTCVAIHMPLTISRHELVSDAKVGR